MRPLGLALRNTQPNQRAPLIKSLLDTVSVEESKVDGDAASGNTAVVVAHLVLQDAGSVNKYVDQFAKSAASARSSNRAQVVSLLCLGEIGRKVDLSANSKASPGHPHRL